MVRSETIARFSVYALIALLPVFFLPVPWMSIAGAKILLATIASIVGLIALVAAALQGGRLILPKSGLLLAAAVIPLIYLISAIATGFSWESFVGDGASKDTVVGVTLWYVALLLTAVLLRRETDVVLSLQLMLGGASVVAVVQLIHLFLPDLTFGGALPFAATSIVGSWHDLGIFLGLIAFISLALLHIGGIGKLSRLNAWFAAIASIALLVVINYGDVWLGIVGLSAFWSFFLYQAGSASKFLRDAISVAWLVGGVAAVVLFFAGAFVHTLLPAPLQVSQFEVRPSWQGTFAIGKEVFAEPARVFFGSGPNTFTREWALYKPLSVNTTEFWNIDFYHGIGFIPTSFVTTGALGLIAWGGICISLMYMLWREIVRRSGVSLRQILLGAAIYLTVFHILYVPGPTLSLLTFILFGVLIAERSWGTGGRTWVLPFSWETVGGKMSVAIALFISVAVIIGGLQSVRALVSDTLVNHAVVQYNESGDVEASSRSISRAVNVYTNNDRAHRAGVELGIIRLTELISTNDVENANELQATLTATIEHGLRAVSIEDQNYLNWLTLARLYGELAGAGVQGAEENARNAYAEARRTNPTNPLPYLGEAQLDVALGDDSAARTNLEEAIAIKPNMAAAHFLLSQVEARAGNFEKATEHAAAVVQLAEQDPLGWYNLGTILYTQEDFETAARAFEQAVGLENNYANALFLLGLSYEQLDRPEDALVVLRKVQELNPDEETLIDAIGRLESDQSVEGAE